MGCPVNIIMKIIHGDCIEEMKKLDENSIDAIITDPPYGLEFMGKDWDKFGGKPDPDNEYKGNGGMKRYFKGNKPIYEWNMNEYQLWTTKWATEALRVLKPGGFLISLGGTRTYHRLTCGIEDAGFKIKDCLMWQYQSGFPKSQSLSMMIDKKIIREEFEKEHGRKPTKDELKALVKEKREFIGNRTRVYGYAKDYDNAMDNALFNVGTNNKKTKPYSELAKLWDGHGTANLKPAYEPIVVAQKPAKGSMIDNILENQVGGINVDGCRIGSEELSYTSTFKRMIEENIRQGYRPSTMKGSGGEIDRSVQGRFPSNIIRTERFEDGLDKFYCILNFPKPSKREKNKGLEELPSKNPENIAGTGTGGQTTYGGSGKLINKTGVPLPVKNNHPTVKPIALFKRLIQLFVPYEQNPNAVVLDPFLGSGTTLCACRELNVTGIGIDQEKDYIKIAKARLSACHQRVSALPK